MKSGDVLTVGKRDIEWGGWIWCTNSSGESRWVPESYLEIEGNSGVANIDYESTELDVQAGEILILGQEESGWFWCTNQAGKSGWVPIKNLDPFDLNGHPISLSLADKKVAKGRWELLIFYRNKGTRSEGQHGILLHYGEVIEPERADQELDTDIGKIKYYLLPREMNFSFYHTGWNFADQKKIRASWEN